jgi:hypothetical protein
LPCEKEKETGSRMSKSEEPDWLGKREGGWKENERVRRARVAEEKEKEAGRRMKESDEPHWHGKKRRRVEGE